MTQADELERLKGLAGLELQLASDDVVRSVMSQPRLEPAVAFGPPPSPPTTLPRRTQRALLMGIQDPNNMGSLLRTGLAMGIDTVFLLPGTPGMSGLKLFFLLLFLILHQIRTHNLCSFINRFTVSTL